MYTAEHLSVKRLELGGGDKVGEGIGLSRFECLFDERSPGATFDRAQ
jgi:hypothetical protein